jgi:hypothetical protein
MVSGVTQESDKLANLMNHGVTPAGAQLGRLHGLQYLFRPVHSVAGVAGDFTH